MQEEVGGRKLDEYVRVQKRVCMPSSVCVANAGGGGGAQLLDEHLSSSCVSLKAFVHHFCGLPMQEEVEWRKLEHLSSSCVSFGAFVHHFCVLPMQEEVEWRKLDEHLSSSCVSF